MASTIVTKNSSTAGAAPTSSDLVQGELAVNVTDKRIYTENGSGTVVELGTNPSVPVTFPDGSASAPSLTNDGDTNTGVFFPAADTVGITTGGTERVRVDSAGNVGVGVTPSAWASAYKTVQIGSQGSFSAAGNLAVFSSNWYSDSSFVNKYITSNYATRYTQYNGTHYWDIAASGTAGNAISFTQAMTLDSSGNLGVGTTSPSYKFDTSGTGVFGSAGGITLTTATNTVGIRGSSGTTVGSAALHLGDNYDTASRQWAVVNGYSAQGALNFLVSSAVNTNPTVSGSVKMTLDSSGNLLVGTTGLTGYRLAVQMSGSTPVRIDRASNTGNLVDFSNGSGVLGNISTNSFSIAYNTTSDYRLKENVQPLTGALARVAALKPCTYTWKASPDETSEGFIAHELAEVCPQAVTGEKDAVDENGNAKYQSIDTSFLVATLVAAIQELKAEVDALKGTK